MSNTTPIVITRDKVKRPWADLEPKIAIALVAAFVSLIAVFLSHYFGFTLPKEVYAIVPVTFSLLAGYFTASTGTVVTNTSTGATEAHTGNTVASISTASVPVQAPAPVLPRVSVPVETPAPSFTDVIGSDPNAATQVLSGASRVADWQRGLPADSPLATPFAAPAQDEDNH